MDIHPAIEEEIQMLQARYPGKVELTLDEYADYFGIGRANAAKHFNNINRGEKKINHKRIGRTIIIPVIDFAYWLAQHKIVDGRPLILPEMTDIKAEMKRRRGFSPKPKYDYRRLG